MMSTKKHKYLVATEDSFVRVDDEFFEGISNRQQALGVCLKQCFALNKRLVEDAVAGKIKKVGRVIVADGLQDTISELDVRWPCLLDEIYSVTRSSSNIVLCLN